MTIEQRHLSAEVVVRRFLDVVRSGRRPGDADLFLAPEVLAHQLTGERESTITRTPADYGDHVRDMIAEHGGFTFEILTMVAADDLVAVTWRQIGEQHPTHPELGEPIVEFGACTYRVQHGRIVEYWLLLDRLGIQRQTERVAADGCASAGSGSR